MNAEAKAFISGLLGASTEDRYELARVAMEWAYKDCLRICQEIDEGAGYGTGAYDAKVAIARRLK